MKKIQNMIPYLLPSMLSFALLPLLMSNSGMAMSILLILLPLVILISGYLYGTKIQKIDLLFIILIGVLFTPVVITLMNESAIPYIFVYAGIALLGNSLGSLSKRK